jgi:hypothetical protein
MKEKNSNKTLEIKTRCDCYSALSQGDISRDSKYNKGNPPLDFMNFSDRPEKPWMD